MKDREHPSRAVAGRDHRVGLLGGEGHDLVHHAMPARFQGPHGKFGVSVVRRGDDHELNLWVVEGLIQAGVALNLPQTRPGSLSLSCRMFPMISETASAYEFLAS